MAYHEQQAWGFCYQGVLWAGVSFPGFSSPCLPASALLSASCRRDLPLCVPSLSVYLSKPQLSEPLILNEMENTLSTASASCV